MVFKSKNITLNNIIKNKYVLYLVALVALIDILGYVIKHEFSAILFFYLVGIITYYYTKNMTLVLSSCLIVTTLAHLIKNMIGLKEGNENLKEGNEKDDDKEKDTKNPEKKAIIERIKLQDEEALDMKENKEMVIKDAKGNSQEEKEKEKEKQKPLIDNKTNDLNAKQLDQYQNIQKLTPGLFNIPNKEQLKKQLGEADKIEAAYDNLEKVIGENGIKSMSNSTKELVRQQNELLKGLKTITPALNEAMGAIGKIDLGELKNLFNATTTKL